MGIIRAFIFSIFWYNKKRESGDSPQEGTVPSRLIKSLKDLLVVIEKASGNSRGKKKDEEDIQLRD